MSPGGMLYSVAGNASAALTIDSAKTAGCAFKPTWPFPARTGRRCRG